MKALKGILAIGVIMALVSCKTVDPFVMSGQVLNSVGEQFISVATAMEEAHEAGVLPEEKYQVWVQFATKFKAAFPAAVRLWNIGVVTNDDLMANQATKLIGDLAAPLAQFAADIQKIVEAP